MDTPQGLSMSLNADNSINFTIGDHDFSDLPVPKQGPIIECLTPGMKNPVYIAWVPVFFEGEISDPQHICRIVHADEAEAVGLPSTE